MSEITSFQHTNNVESTTPIAHSHDQAPLGEYTTGNGHQDAPIPGLDEVILKPNLLTGESSRNIVTLEKHKGPLESTGQSETKLLKNVKVYCFIISVTN
ncbi:hypothetical protein HYPSUDRAFT_413521 [Hypholoma sublateritium FD-334 SS-4]|uniref:Uncharacterized protein n=1 Tax=Hypholoma sublateritium (strain FD-334 SS-4) TaxID=945553 RepID=A0A0D2P2U4_HYPSF|nr:hypothetical protein HYPSUDRAFT_413521 [Hypholoma sublateritium FD-334 SS-4]